MYTITGQRLICKVSQYYIQRSKNNNMAFVFGKAPKDNHHKLNQTSPGPGQYAPADKIKDEGFAPFNSSTFKISAFDVIESNAGPGSYNPKTAKEIIYDKKNRNTSSFSSKVDRFTDKNKKQKHVKSTKRMRATLASSSQAYRPQTSTSKHVYSEAIQKTKQKMNQLQTANRGRKIDSIGNQKEFVRIVLSNPNNTQVQHSVFIDPNIRRKQSGPGSYNIDAVYMNRKRSAASVVDWSKSTGNRFTSKKSKTPGPGAYQVDQPSLKKDSSCLSASFAYQGLRSHLDQVIYKTRMPFKVKVIEQKGLRDRYPGPGHYQPQHNRNKSFHYGEQCFGSTQFPNNDQEYQAARRQPGPGHYGSNQKSQDYKQKLKKTREKLFGKTRPKLEKAPNLCQMNKDQVRNQTMLQLQRTANKFYSLKERCSSKIGNFSHAERWQTQQRAGLPGPGQYQVQKRLTNQDYNMRAAGLIQEGNGQERDSYIIKRSEDTPFYDVQRNDMGKVALRIKKNIDNLKQIQIEKAPFNTKEQRFSSHKQKDDKRHSYQDPQMVTWNSNCQQERQARYRNLIKNAAENSPNPSAAFKSGTKRSWAIPSHYIGPGNYNCQPQSLQKKSFNQEYNYKAPSKIRPTYRTKSSLS